MTTPSPEAIEAAANAWPGHARVNFPIENLEPSCEECGEAFGWAGIDQSEEAKRHREHVAYIALTAALPTLEQQIREQVAREILDERIDGTASLDHLHNAALEIAARIARGKDTQ